MAALVLSKHAQDRARSRGIATSDIATVIHQAQQSTKLDDGKIKFQKIIDGRLHQVIAKYLEPERKWLVVSVWVRGEEDRAPLVWLIISWPFRVLWSLCKIIAKTAGKK